MRHCIGLFLLLALLSASPAQANGPADEKARTTTVQATGIIEPEEVVDVGAQVAGQIARFGADPRNPNKTIDYGTQVAKGTILAQIDPTLYQALVEQARAKLLRAQATLRLQQARLVQADRSWQRAEKLWTSNAISSEDHDAARSRFEVGKGEVDVARAEVTLAQASLRETEVNLGYTTIKSPIQGVVLDRRVNVGQTVVASLNAPSLFLIARDLKRMQVWASVPEADIGRIHIGQTGRFTVRAYPKEEFTAKVVQIRLNASTVQNKVLYTVVAETDNANGKLLPYLTAEVRFLVGKESQEPRK